MSTTFSFSGAVVTILAIFMCTASQCRGQSDHPNLQIRQEKMANGGTSAPITVVGVATIEEPSSYNFTCQRLDGADGSNLQWEYVDEPTRTLQTTRVNNDICLTLNNVGGNAVGLYRCKDGSTNEAEELLLTMDNPAVLPVKSNISLLENSSLHLAVYSSGDPIEKVRYKWRMNDVQIDIANLSADMREATIPSVQFQGDVQYSCMVDLQVGVFFKKQFAYFFVTVYVPPVIIKSPANATVDEHSKVTLECHATGNPPPVITWTHNGVTIGDEEGIVNLQESNGSTSLPVVRSTYTLTGVQYEDRGAYSCIASIPAKELGLEQAELTSESHKAALVVHVPLKVEVEIGRPRTNPPTLIQDGSNLVYSEGTEHELLCSATGVPTPTLSWLYKGVSVGDNQVTGTNPLTLSWDGPLSTNHSGTYTCRAEYEVATVTSTFILTVRPRTNGDVHVQLRILTKDCTKWSPEQLALARTSVTSTIYNNTLARCGCSFEIHQFSGNSLVCSYEVRDAVSFRAIIVSTSEVRASSIYAAFSSWARTGPTIVILGMEAQLDTSCDPLADSATSPECPVDNGSSSFVLEPWLIAVIGTGGAVCLIVVVVAAVFSCCCCCCCCCRKTGMYNIYTKNMRRSFSYRADSFQRNYVEDAPGRDYVMDSITEADGKNHMYDQPENVRRESENYRSNGGVILVGSSSENNSNTGGYSMLHPDDEEDQVTSPTQQSQHLSMRTHYQNSLTWMQHQRQAAIAPKCGGQPPRNTVVA